MDLNREINLDGTTLNVTLHFDRLDISGTGYNSRYIQFGDQKNAGASLVFKNFYSSANIPLNNWKNTICVDSNVIKVMKGNRKNKFCNDEKELMSRLEDCFTSYLDDIQLNKVTLDNFKISEDIWYNTCMYLIPRTGYAIYAISSASEKFKNSIFKNLLVVKKRDIDLEFRPVVIDAELDIDSGTYFSDEISGIGFNDEEYIPIDGTEGSHNVKFLDVQSTFFN